MPVAITPKKTRELKCGKYLLPVYERTHVMGVLNRTPDSFSDGGRFMDEAAALGHVRKMSADGADIIDIGGESTRPGSEPVSLREELNRTIPLIERLSREITVPISIDTSKSEVARLAIRAGASMVNDITGLKSDPEMAGVISDMGAAVCVMHIKGTPKTMQDHPAYEDLMLEILEGLRESIEIALGSGVSPDRIVIDPGIGFGKTAAHNLTIIKRLSELMALDKPILIGVSRKSFIGKVLNREAQDRLMGTAVASASAIANGANIIRVHDVKEMQDVAKMADAIKAEKL